MHRELVIAAAAGDDIAFERLVATEAPLVYRAAIAVVGSADDAQEVVQEATVRAWRELRKLRDPDRWPAWYRRIVLRQAFDAARRRRARAGERDVDSVELPVDDPSDDWLDRAAVLIALATLSADDRAILGLRFGADLEVPDVAAVLDIPLGTAKSRLHRAIARLAEAVGDDHDR